MILTHLVLFSFLGGASASNAPPPPPVVAQAPPTPAGKVSKPQQRRRYIMPDGTALYATTDEAFEWLRLYSKPVEMAPQPKAERQKIVMPAIELAKRDVRFVPATDSIPGTYKAVISARFNYQPPPEATRQAQDRFNRMRADDEAIWLLMQ